MNHWSVRAAVVWCLLAMGGCGGSSDEDQVTATLRGFFQDVVDRDVKGVCDALTPKGRGQVISDGTRFGRPPPPATRQQCVADGLLPFFDVDDLDEAVGSGGVKVRDVRIVGDRATAVVDGSLPAKQQLRKTDRGWRVDYVDLPVRE